MEPSTERRRGRRPRLVEKWITNLHLDEAHRVRLVEIADRDDLSISQVIRRILDAALGLKDADEANR